VSRVTDPDDLSLPAGRYLSCAIDVQADNAGQTKALLMRNRIFAARAGVEPTVLSFGANSDLDERREVLLDRGLLAHGVGLANIYEDYRDTDWRPGSRCPTCPGGSGGRPR
jgi:poly(glycerol-phosphate) alpha-glucosyltransferase